MTYEAWLAAQTARWTEHGSCEVCGEVQPLDLLDDEGWCALCLEVVGF